MYSRGIRGHSGALTHRGIVKVLRGLGFRYSHGYSGTGVLPGTHGYPQVLAHAWAGFNATLFAYGQTGSGKTHTMVGEVGGTV